MAAPPKEWAKYTFERKQRGRGQPHPQYARRPTENQSNDSDDDNDAFSQKQGSQAASPQQQHLAQENEALQKELDALKVKALEQLKAAAEQNLKLEQLASLSGTNLAALKDKYQQLQEEYKTTSETNEKLKMQLHQDEATIQEQATTQAKSEADYQRMLAELESKLREQIHKQLQEKLVEETTVEITEIRREQQALVEENNKLKTQLDDGRASRGACSEEDYRQLRKQLEEERERNTVERRRLMDEQNSLRTSHSILEAENRKLKGQVNHASSELTVEEKSRFSQQVEDSNRQKALLEDTVAKLKSENAQLNADRTTLNEQLTRLQNVSPPPAPASPIISLAKFKEQEARNEELNNRLQELSGTLNSLQGNIEHDARRADDLAKDNQYLKERIEGMLNERNSLQHEAEAARQAVDDSRKLLEDAKRESEQRTNQNESLRQKANELLEQNELLQKEASKVNDHNVVLESRVKQLVLDNERLMMDLGRAADSNHRVIMLTEQLTLTTAELAGARNQLLKCQTDSAHVMASLEAERTNAEADFTACIDAMKNQMATLSAENAILTNDNVGLVRQIEELTLTVEKLQRACDDVLMAKNQVDDEIAIMRQKALDPEVEEQVIVEIRGTGYRADLLRKVYKNHCLVTHCLKQVRGTRAGEQYLKSKRSPHPSDYVLLLDQLHDDLLNVVHGGAAIIQLYFTSEEKLTVGLSTEAYKPVSPGYHKPLPLENVVTTTTRITTHGDDTTSAGGISRSSTPVRMAGVGSRSSTPVSSLNNSPPTSKGRPISPSPLTEGIGHSTNRRAASIKTTRKARARSVSPSPSSAVTRHAIPPAMARW